MKVLIWALRCRLKSFASLIYSPVNVIAAWTGRCPFISGGEKGLLQPWTGSFYCNEHFVARLFLATRGIELHSDFGPRSPPLTRHWIRKETADGARSIRYQSKKPTLSSNSKVLVQSHSTTLFPVPGSGCSVIGPALTIWLAGVLLSS